MEIEIQISPITAQCSTNKQQKTLAANAQEENITRSYSSRLRNQNAENIVNICELNILETLENFISC